MCGFVVVRSKKPTSSVILQKMQKNIEHRGNDDSGIVLIDKNNNFKIFDSNESNEEFQTGFAFQRLSIQDLSSGGHQPMLSRSNRYLIVFNGEIYNFKELRKDLIKSGHQFYNNSDTEVVLKLYELHGENMLSQLNGMFSLVIFDRLKDEFFIARDRLGIKPLYYFYKDNLFFIASEIKAFKAHPNFKVNFNSDKTDEYLMFGYIAGEETLFTNVKECLPGHYIKFYKDKLTITKYWDNNKGNNQSENFGAQEKFINLLDSSINYQLISDVEVGGQLSGGIDSSLITSIAAKSNKSFKKTFSVIFENESINEEKYIDIINKKYCLHENKILMKPKDIVDNLEKATWSFDNPLSQPNAIGIYLLAKEAKKSLKVLLSGEGADEIFGGYDRYNPARIFSKFGIIGQAINNFRSKKMKRDGNDLESLLVCLSSRSKESEIKKIFKDFKLSRAINSRLKILKQEMSGSTFEKFLNYEQKTYLNELLLRQDKMCMAHGIENRVPFLDHRIAEFSKNISSNHKTRLNLMPRKFRLNNSTKPILKNISTDYFGNEFTYRNKLGFNMPLNEVLNNVVNRDYFVSLIDEANKLDNIDIDIDRIKSINNNQSNFMWSILALGAWSKVHRDF